MRDKMREAYYGVSNEGLLRSALARSQHAARYENADGLKQAAYLFHGLLMDHGFVQGNKRTAYLALEWFLHVNGPGSLQTADENIIAMCFAAENEKWTVEQVAQWLRERVK
ncbi:MAG: type II toxin-antitoxin system death-on-curing family toxin [Planctomycetes bacterium]|nr:type II toxin-antitoxin system death-on-curing family toxin [Planctomycetota bacterium]